MVDLSKTIRIEPKRRSAKSTRELDLDLRDLSTRAELATAIFDWSSAPELQAELVRDLSKTVVLQPPAAVDLGKTVVLESPVETEPTLAAAVPDSPSSPTLDATIYDGGALREYARKQAAEAPTQVRGESGARERPSDGSPRASPPLAWWRLVAAAPARYRSLPRSRRLALGLLLCTLLAAATGALPLVPRRGRPAGVEQTPSRAPAARATPELAGSAAEARPAPASAPSAPVPGLPVSPAPDPELERSALRAAFDGNKRAAVAAYERLAAAPGSETFKLAARLVREDRVRRP